MTVKSALASVHLKGQFGDYDGKNDTQLLKISETTNLLIVQIVQYKHSSILSGSIEIENLKLTNKSLSVSSNNDTRILWCGPKNWFLISTNKELLKDIHQAFKKSDFAVTDLSHSRAVIELEGSNSKEVLKKGCPINIDDFKKNYCFNSTFNGISISVDFLNDNPEKIRILALRSFGESLYHSLTDSCLEFGYKGI